MAFILYLFFIYPFALLGFALNAAWLAALASVVFLLFLVTFDRQMKSQLIRELQARELKSNHHRYQSIERMIGAYAPDDYRMRVRVRVYRYPNAEPELKVWLSSKWRLELFVSEGFFDRAQESDWRHFLQSWSTLKWSLIRRQNRLHALGAMFNRWKGPTNAYRHWVVSFWLFPLERVLKISRI